MQSLRECLPTCVSLTPSLLEVAKPPGLPFGPPQQGKCCGPDDYGREHAATLLATTLGRGQSKAPLEGTFGLFNQDLPELCMTGETPRDRARNFLEVAFCSWARGRNGRPRKQLGGKSPAEYYKAQLPTEEEKAEARRWIRELQRRQQDMRRTREQRADPEKLAFLKEALLALGIPDSNNHLAVNLAYYSREAIVSGVSTFQAMLQAGTVPDGADPGRYLGGIIRNLHEELELSLTTEFQLQNRVRFRDICLRSLLRRNEEILHQLHPPDRLLSILVDQALSALAPLTFTSGRHAVTIEHRRGVAESSNSRRRP